MQPLRQERHGGQPGETLTGNGVGGVQTGVHNTSQLNQAAVST